ncbi:MAG: TIGR03668 family PPOX class F420-dependent oxidoreductase [Halapricum sp.]
MFTRAERRYVESARIGRLATADTEARPHAVPVCFAFMGEKIVSAIDEKPQRAPTDGLRRSRDIEANPRVALLVDHYTEDWDRLGWVQVRGTAGHVKPTEAPHAAGIAALREKYEQYADHDLESRPLVRIDPGSVQSWGVLERPREEERS